MLQKGMDDNHFVQTIFISIVEVTGLDTVDRSSTCPSQLKKLQACYAAVLQNMADMHFHHHW